MKSAETDDKTPKPATEESSNQAVKDCNSSNHQSFFAQQYSSSEGGMLTDMYCPGCGEEISGSYLPVFMCPHCEIQIWRDDKGNVTHHEQKHTCPECGHVFGDLTDEAPTEFRRMVRNFEQKAESAFMGLDRIVNRILA